MLSFYLSLVRFNTFQYSRCFIPVTTRFGVVIFTNACFLGLDRLWVALSPSDLRCFDILLTDCVSFNNIITILISIFLTDSHSCWGIWVIGTLLSLLCWGILSGLS